MKTGDKQMILQILPGIPAFAGIPSIEGKNDIIKMCLSKERKMEKAVARSIL